MNATELHLKAHRDGFGPGETSIVRHDEAADPIGLGLSVLRLAQGQRLEHDAPVETAWLLMHGRLRGWAGDAPFEFERRSLFDESASCVHVAAGTRVQFEALSDCELTVYRCPNTRAFEPRVFHPADVPDEHRGAGQVRDRCLRFVRTVFDRRNSSEAVELVLGEVVTLPGGWSSYPPHHHPQAEIYHYRFTEPQGFGHAELGDDVVKVRQFDTVRIPPGHDHAQCAAPGYGMYYSWVIRHLPGLPYTVPEFTPEHAWTLRSDAQFWWPGRRGHR
ncbi:MAG TPA: 5-deoxy-glucuronate isomerase [Steroidobacteraceae bacterium]|nr:5-deoxy-glucuronate isomerase [Steroidobacteraceae bacterium]